jgi:hypothetical protein
VKPELQPDCPHGNVDGLAVDEPPAEKTESCLLVLADLQSGQLII